jgi:hypothetical protein
LTTRINGLSFAALLLDHLALIFQVSSQDLAQLRSWLGLRQRELRYDWDSDCNARETQKFAPDNLHDSLGWRVFAHTGLNPASEPTFRAAAITECCFVAMMPPS